MKKTLSLLLALLMVVLLVPTMSMAIRSNCGL